VVPADRLADLVRQIYGLFELSKGPNWLAYRLQDESSIMSDTIVQMERLVRASAELLLLREWSITITDIDEKKAMYGFVCGLLSPLTYRSLRMVGGLEPD